MLNIKPETAFTNVFESGLSPMALNSHLDRYWYTKTIISEPPADRIVSMTRMTNFQILCFDFLMN